MTKFAGDTGGRGRLAPLAVELSGSNEGHQTTHLSAGGALRHHGSVGDDGDREDDGARRQVRSGSGWGTGGEEGERVGESEREGASG